MVIKRGRPLTVVWITYPDRPLDKVFPVSSLEIDVQRSSNVWFMQWEEYLYREVCYRCRQAKSRRQFRRLRLSGL